MNALTFTLATIFEMESVICVLDVDQLALNAAFNGGKLGGKLFDILNTVISFFGFDMENSLLNSIIGLLMVLLGQ